MPGQVKSIRRCQPTDPRLIVRVSITVFLFAAFSLPVAFGAADLVTVLGLAKKTDPVYLAAELTYRADRQLIGQARADLLPYVSATANQAQNDKIVNGTPQNFSSSGYTLSIRQPLFNWAYFQELRQAKAEVRKAEAKFSAARQQLIRRVTVLYFSVLSAGDTLALSRSEKQSISKQLELAKARLEVGLGTITEVHDANARFMLATAQSVDAENAVQDARQALAETVGSAPVELKLLKKNIPLLLPDPRDVEKWIDRAQQQNLSLLAAIAETEIARRDLSVKRANHLPTLDIVGARTQSDSVDSAGSDLISTNNSIKLELTVPIFSGGKTRALSSEAKYRYQASIQNTEAVRRNIVRATRNAFLGIQGDISRVAALAQAVVAGESALEAKNIGFEAGINNNIDVLNAQRDLFSSRRNYALSRYSYLLNLLNLQEAVGTLSTKDVEKINGWLE